MDLDKIKEVMSRTLIGDFMEIRENIEYERMYGGLFVRMFPEEWIPPCQEEIDAAINNIQPIPRSVYEKHSNSVQCRALQKC